MMGGPGGGCYTGRRGRAHGGTNSAASIEAMRIGMAATHRRKATRPDACQRCGAEPSAEDPLEWFRTRDENDEPGERRWLCGRCMLGKMNPLNIENFTRSGTSNLDSAQARGYGTEHRKGQGIDRAPRKRRTKK